MDIINITHDHYRSRAGQRQTSTSDRAGHRYLAEKRKQVIGNPVGVFSDPAARAKPNKIQM